MENEEQLLEGFHAVFVIVYLQELAWIFTPLIISLNVLIHTFLKDMDYATRWVSIVVSLFFSVSGLCIASSLYFVHKKTLGAHRTKFLWPYIILKFIRTLVLLTVACIILSRDDLRTNYFHISIYGIVESISNLVAIEVCYRTWRYMTRANQRKRRCHQSDAKLIAQNTVTRIKRSESLRERREFVAEI
uniref:XK-related protein n=1 Tax=Parascaris univalens TaxID=6257 RepID=A0A915BX27_PARUN